MLPSSLKNRILETRSIDIPVPRKKEQTDETANIRSVIFIPVISIPV